MKARPLEFFSALFSVLRFFFFFSECCLLFAAVASKEKSVRVKVLSGRNFGSKINAYVKLATSLGECKTTTMDKCEAAEWNETFTIICSGPTGESCLREPGSQLKNIYSFWFFVVVYTRASSVGDCRSVSHAHIADTLSVTLREEKTLRNKDIGSVEIALKKLQPGANVAWHRLDGAGEVQVWQCES